MADILSTLGEDLAIAVKQKNLPTVMLDIDRPRIRKFRLFDMLLWRLKKVMNSTFFVGDDLNYLNAYTNALAVLMSQPDEFAITIDAHIERVSHEIADYRETNHIQRIVGKRLHTIHMDKLLAFSGRDSAFWYTFFTQLIEECTEKGYFLVIDNYHKLRLREDGLFYYEHPAWLRLFFATQGRTTLTFIAPLIWTNYVNHIEGPWIQHRGPLFFTPRPSGLPYVSRNYIAQPPDAEYDFSDQAVDLS